MASLESNPQTGYEIARDFDSGVGYFWHATHQQIYRELSKLADENLVDFEQIQQQSKPAKKRYVLNEIGRRVLAEWLNATTKLQPIRDPLLVKISAGHLASPEKLMAEVHLHREDFEQRLAVFKKYDSSYRACKGSTTKQIDYLYLTLRRGIIVCEGWLKWADEVLDFLAKEIEH